jgi:hypothetical protein
LLGANNQVYLNECDKCNSIFNKYESHLAIFLRPYLTLNNVRGKRKIPKFESRANAGELKTEIRSVSDKIKEIYVNDRLEDIEIDENTKKVYITFRKAPFVPLKVYKVIARIGLSLMSVTGWRSINMH